MKASIAAKLASLDSRLKEIDARLSDPGVVGDLDNFRKLSQERAEIEPVVAAFGEYRKAAGDIAAAEEMAGEPDMKSFAEDEIRKQLIRFGGDSMAQLYDQWVLKPGDLPAQAQLGKVGLRLVRVESGGAVMPSIVPLSSATTEQRELRNQWLYGKKGKVTRPFTW